MLYLLSVLEAIVRSDLCNHCLSDKIQSLAIQKGANTVADLLYLTFQSYLPSEPMARVEGLATIEAPVKPSRTFSEALAFLRSWGQQVLTVVHDLGGNPEPLKLYSTLCTLISSLVASDNSFAMEVSQIYRQIGIKTLCNDVCLLTTIDLLEVDLASRARKEEEERRKQKECKRSSRLLYLHWLCQDFYQANLSQLHDRKRLQQGRPMHILTSCCYRSLS